MTNRELQKLVPQEHGLGEQKFLAAKKADKIQEASDEAIAGALKYAMLKIGLREKNWPSELEKVLLIGHLRDHFPDLTVVEIRIAFDWGIGGRTGAEMNCYENFSCLFLTGVMKSYEALERIVQIKADQPLPALPPVTLSAEEQVAYEQWLETDFAKKLSSHGITLPK